MRRKTLSELLTILTTGRLEGGWAFYLASDLATDATVDVIAFSPIRWFAGSPAHGRDSNR
jgi:hypothetical protein